VTVRVSAAFANGLWVVMRAGELRSAVEGSGLIPLRPASSEGNQLEQPAGNDEDGTEPARDSVPCARPASAGRVVQQPAVDVDGGAQGVGDVPGVVVAVGVNHEPGVVVRYAALVP
jgi:hypothetical protein